MKRVIAPAALVIALSATLVLGIVTGAQAAQPKACSVATLEGGFGFTSSGTLLNLPAPLAGPFGEIGRQAFDGQGNTEGAATLSANGNINRVTIQGTYVVNPDCTGSMTDAISPLCATFHV